jgi:hypothetical protein
LIVCALGRLLNMRWAGKDGHREEARGEEQATK